MKFKSNKFAPGPFTLIGIVISVAIAVKYKTVTSQEIILTSLIILLIGSLFDRYKIIAIGFGFLIGAIFYEVVPWQDLLQYFKKDPKALPY